MQLQLKKAHVYFAAFFALQGCVKTNLNAANGRLKGKGHLNVLGFPAKTDEMIIALPFLGSECVDL